MKEPWVYQADVKIYLCLTAKLSRKLINFVIGETIKI